jgi:dCTP deaminase
MPGGSGLSLFPDLRQELRSYKSGVLPYQEIRALVEAGRLRAPTPIAEDQLQPASIDLRLGPVAHHVRASFLPGPRRGVIESLDHLRVQRLDLEQGAVLLKGNVYVIPLEESLNLPAATLGKSNPKSTTGRLDVFARLITDYAEQFDRVAKGYQGPLFVEVVPKTFNIHVRRGTKLNQLRFLRGIAPHTDMSRQALRETEDLVFGEDGEPLRATVLSGLWFSVDLKARDPSGLIGWRAAHDAPVIDLDKVAHYDPAQFWEPVHQQPGLELILKPGEFYILGSKERVRVPPSYAAEMVPYDPSMGEFRVHYAGFFDPGFGYGAGEVKGTRAILEVRSHEVPYALRDGQNIGRLIYERLLAPSTKLYGAGAGSSYQEQELGLSKQFRQQPAAASRPATGDRAPPLPPAPPRAVN